MAKDDVDAKLLAIKERVNNYITEHPDEDFQGIGFLKQLAKDLKEPFNYTKIQATLGIIANSAGARERHGDITGANKALEIMDTNIVALESLSKDLSNKVQAAKPKVVIDKPVPTPTPAPTPAPAPAPEVIAKLEPELKAEEIIIEVPEVIDSKINKGSDDEKDQVEEKALEEMNQTGPSTPQAATGAEASLQIDDDISNKATYAGHLTISAFKRCMASEQIKSFRAHEINFVSNQTDDIGNKSPNVGKIVIPINDKTKDSDATKIAQALLETGILQSPTFTVKATTPEAAIALAKQCQKDNIALSRIIVGDKTYTGPEMQQFLSQPQSKLSEPMGTLGKKFSDPPEIKAESEHSFIPSHGDKPKEKLKDAVKPEPELAPEIAPAQKPPETPKLPD